MSKTRKLIQQIMALTVVLMLIFIGCSAKTDNQSSDSSDASESSQLVSSSESYASAESEVSETSDISGGTSESSLSEDSSGNETSSSTYSKDETSSSSSVSSGSPSSKDDGPAITEFDREKFYILTNAATGEVLTANTTGRRVSLQDKMASDDLGAQHWQIYEYKKGVFCLVAKNTGKSLTAPSTSLTLEDTEIAQSQRWSITSTDGKNFKISRGSLFLTGGSTVTMTAESNSDSQLWKISQLQTKNWSLVWSDEFNGTSIDRSVWSYEDYKADRGDQQIYTDSSKNSFVKDGFLTIRTLKEPTADKWDSSKVYPYSSASMMTIGKKAFLYGKFEIRCKIPSGPRIWPAFWTDGNVDRDWPTRGEIDIFEFYGDKPGEIKANVWKGRDSNLTSSQQWGAKGFTLPEGKKFPDDFHVIHLEWDSVQMRFYCDGIHYATYNISKGAGDQRAFTQPHFIWINTAIQNDKSGSSAASNTYPQDYIIDYIRVYQQK